MRLKRQLLDLLDKAHSFELPEDMSEQELIIFGKNTKTAERKIRTRSTKGIKVRLMIS